MVIAVLLAGASLPGSHAVTASTTAAAFNAAVSVPANQISTGTFCVVSSYPSAVMADAPFLYWRLAETSGSTAADTSGNGNFGTYSGVTLGFTPGALACSTNPAASFPSSIGSVIQGSNAATGPNTFSIEIWFRTASTTGGRIFGFGNKNTTWSNTSDRHLYLTDAGSVTFGVDNGTVRTVASATGLNNGLWHHAVGVLSGTSMVLYVDGVNVASRNDAAAGAYSGFWRLGDDRMRGWPNSPTDAGLAGTLDEAAIYNTALSATRVAAHHTAGRFG